MQEFLTFIIIIVTAITVIYKVIKSLKLFKKKYICNGCNTSCSCSIKRNNI